MKLRFGLNSKGQACDLFFAFFYNNPKRSLDRSSINRLRGPQQQHKTKNQGHPFTRTKPDLVSLIHTVDLSNKMASESNSIPVMYKPANMMEAGPNGNSLQSAAARSHPVDMMQRRSGVYCSLVVLGFKLLALSSPIMRTFF